MKQVKQLLHRKSEAESAKNLANWQIYPLFLLAASPEIILFLPPWHFHKFFFGFFFVLSLITHIVCFYLWNIVWHLIFINFSSKYTYLHQHVTKKNHVKDSVVALLSMLKNLQNIKKSQIVFE